MPQGEDKLENQFLEDCKGIMTEGIFNHRWMLIETYHRLGLRIHEEKGDVDDLVSQVTEAIPNLTRRTCLRAVQFAKKYPRLDKLPLGKNCSWHKVCNQLLPEPKGEKWSWRIDDVTKIHAEFLCPDRAKINRQVRTMGKMAQEMVGGIEVFKEE